nr:MAG TPA: hypothetical protein [Caudoviricetes sp.]
MYLQDIFIYLCNIPIKSAEICDGFSSYLV